VPFFIGISKASLVLLRRTVHGVEDRPPKHVLIDGIKGASSGLHWMEPLVLRDKDGVPTAEWHRIYD